MSGIVEARALTKNYGSHRAVHKLSFSVQHGEVVGLLGLNGAGKTTTLRLLSGLLFASSGQVIIGGKHMAHEPEAARALIGFLPETPPLYPEMSVRGYLAFVARIKGMRGNIESAIDAALSATDLLALQQAPIGALSHGTRRRIGIAQAVVHRPALVLLDEPTSGLDPMQVVHMRRLIRSLRGKHTVIVSSHILSEIHALCDRILVMDGGRIAAEGTEAQLAQRVSARMQVSIEVRGDVARLTECLAHLKYVQGHTIRHNTSPHIHADIELAHDAREELLQALLASKLGVLGLSRTHLELESIFLRLMGSDILGTQKLEHTTQLTGGGL